ncbi:MAG TPA: DUF2169 domain-containing protein [Polyangiaceae bacterium]
MRIKNARLFPTGSTFGQNAQGDWFLSVIVKGTFRLEQRSSAARAAERQLPILSQDEPYDPKQIGGALKFESDLVPFKPRSDVLLVGNAHTPFGRPRKFVDVALQVGPVHKQIRVFGERRWSFKDLRDPVPLVAGPLEFVEMPLTWDRAYGGVDEQAGVRADVPSFRPWYSRNFIGSGFAGSHTIESIDERPLPNLEDPRDPIHFWNSRPRPAGCGYYPRNSEPRVRYGGTYDDQWRAERAPARPRDFCFDYYNAADPDLQVQGYLRGNERGMIENVTPGGGRMDFVLPCIRPRFTVTRGDTPATHAVSEAPAALDTLVLMPDDAVFCVVWRAVIAPCVPEAIDIEEVRIDYEALLEPGAAQ